jgi:hypothetical protein
MGPKSQVKKFLSGLNAGSRGAFVMTTNLWLFNGLNVDVLLRRIYYGLLEGVGCRKCTTILIISRTV